MDQTLGIRFRIGVPARRREFWRGHARRDEAIGNVSQVQQMGGGLGPVLVRMRRGVAGQVALFPVGWWPNLVVVLERSRVVRAFIAEHGAKSIGKIVAQT